MNTTKNKLFLCLLLLGISFNLFAQHGIGTNEPNLNAALDVTASDKGLLVPRLELNDAAVFFPGVTATTSDVSLLVFNTNTISTTASGLQGTGFYFWNGTQWEKLISRAENIISSLACYETIVEGTIFTGEAANVTVNLLYTGGNGSSYTEGTVVQSGVELGMTGLTATLQAGTLANGTGSLTYSITGTPATSGNAYFGIEFGGHSCLLVVPVNDSSSGGTAVVSNWDCSGPNEGTLYRGEVANGVTKIIYADVTKAGTYKLSMTSNGIIYSSEGSFAAPGNDIEVLLTASGTPAASGTSSFTLDTTPNCSFEVEVLDRSSGGTATVSSYDCTGTSSGTLRIGTPITEGSVTQQIMAEVTTGGTYDITTTANGVTFTASGTFAGTGSQPITLTAKGTPTAMGTHTFTLSTTPNCSFDRETTAEASSGGTALVVSWDCTGTATGSSTVGLSAAGNTKTVVASVTTAGTYNISASANGVTYSAAGTFGGTGLQNVTLIATGTPTAGGDHTFSLNVTPTCSFDINTIDPSSGGTAAVTGYVCSATGTGTMIVGTALTEGEVSHQFTATVSTTGTYDISAVANGVTFTASGTFASTGSQPITLTATGTPTAQGTHTFTLSTTPNCSFTRETVNAASVACDANGIEGNYVINQALTAANKFSVTVTNGDAVNNLVLSLANTDISLSGAGAAGISAGVTSPTPSITIAGGASATIEYDLTGMPTSLGNLIIDWAIGALSCTQSRTIAPGDATFTDATNNIYTFSVNDTSIPLNVQGTFTSGTTKDLAYTGGTGIYAAYTSPDQPIDAAFAEDGASDWTFSYSYAPGTFTATGVLEVTYTTKKAGVETNFQALRVDDVNTINFDFVNLPLMVNGNTKPNTLGLDEGGDAIRGGIALGGNASGPAYDAVNVNDWVRINQAEYNAMSTVMPSTVKSGANDAFLTGARLNVNGDGRTWGGTNFSVITTVGTSGAFAYTTIPTNQYVYGMSIRTSNLGNLLDSRVGVSTGQTGTITWLGSTLPASPADPNHLEYYVMKRPTHQTSSVTYPAWLNRGSTAYSSTFGHHHAPNAVTSGIGAAGYTIVYQLLSNPTKQW